MKTSSVLGKKVLSRTDKQNLGPPPKAVLSQEAINALKLSQKYKHIRPKPYVLPLDALAGLS